MHPTSGHMGSKKTLARITERYMWKGVGKDVNKFVSLNACEDNNHASSFMVDLAMGYSNELPTVIGELICESWVFGLQVLAKAIPIWKVIARIRNKLRKRKKIMWFLRPGQVDSQFIIRDIWKSLAGGRSFFIFHTVCLEFQQLEVVCQCYSSVTASCDQMYPGYHFNGNCQFLWSVFPSELATVQLCTMSWIHKVAGKRTNRPCTDSLTPVKHWLRFRTVWVVSDWTETTLLSPWWVVIITHCEWNFFFTS